MTKQPNKFLKNSLNWLLASLLLLGCNQTQNNALEKQLFRYNEHKNISSLDPAFAKDNANIWAIHQIFNGLVEMDEKMHVKPSIASKWEISKNGTLYTFSCDQMFIFTATINLVVKKHD